MSPGSEATAIPTHSALIIGSGFGGQLAAIHLRKRGITDFVVLERRDFLGGTWCQNSYPGAAVDVQSPLYCLAGEPFPWTQMFAEQDELQRYTEHLITKHRLREHAITGAEVVAATWQDDAWEVRTRGKGSFRGRFLINASGPLSTPSVPHFPGMDEYRGAAFHSNAWDHRVDYRGLRVAVVGTGASAAQVIPALQPEVAQLHVFQRTPHWVLPRGDRTFSPAQRRALARPAAQTALRTAIYWSLETRVLGFKYSERMLRLMAETRALRHLEAQVADPQLRARLTPDYTIGCKRIILSNTLYPALSAANTTLHDQTDSIDHFDATGIVTTRGTHVDVDLVVWSTGYDATDGMIDYPITGRDGRVLQQTWEEFPRAYLGTTVPFYPNLFIVTGPNTGIGHTSALFVIESQMAYIMRAMAEVRDAGATSIEVTATAEGDYTRMIHREMERTVWKRGGCRSWYQSKSGHVVAMYPGFSFSFRLAAKRYRPEHHVIA